VRGARSRPLTELELEFMHALWAAGKEVTTEDIAAGLRVRGRDLSGGSVRKILSILMRKGFVSRRRLGKGFLYRAEVGKKLATSSLLLDLLGRAFEGQGALLVGALMDSGALSQGDVAEIERLIRAEREET
jgi:BlaI family penicillinase repressor